MPNLEFDNPIQDAIRRATQSGPADVQGQQNVGDVPDDFQYCFGVALLAEHLDASRIPPDQWRSIMEAAYADPYLAGQEEAGTLRESDIRAALFSPGTTAADPQLAVTGLHIAQSQGRTLSSTQLGFLASQGTAGGNTVTNTIMRVAAELGTQAGMDPQTLQTFENLALATAYQESGFNPRAVGDSGHSVGLFQLHDQGEGAGMGESRYDPETNARRALSEFVSLWKTNPNIASDPGAWAAQSQRPADQGAYALAVDGWLNEIGAGKIPTAHIGPAGLAGNLPSGTVSEYSPIISAYRKYAGKEPDISTLYAILGHGSDAQSWDDYIRSLPSHIPGMTFGQRFDLRTQADSTMQKLLGHDATDGIVKELFDAGNTNPHEVEHFIGHLSENALNAMGRTTYNTIQAANQPHMQSIYSESGFDPRVAVAQFNANGGQPATNTESAAAVDQQSAGGSGDFEA